MNDLSSKINIINEIGKNKPSKWEKFCYLKEENNLIYLKNLYTKEIKSINKDRLKRLIGGSNPFNLRSYMPNDYIKDKVNLVGKNYSLEESFKFKKIISRKKMIVIEIENLYDKVIKTATYKNLINENQNPFCKHSYTSPKLIKLEINKIGSSQKNIWQRYKYIGHTRVKSHISVIVQNLKTKEIKNCLYKSIILRGTNPFDFSNGYPEMYVRQLINNYGKKFKNPYEKFYFVKTTGKGKQRRILLKNKKTQEEKWVGYSKIISSLYNPFLLKIKFPKMYIEEQVNLKGKSFKLPIEKSQYVGHLYKNGLLYIKIQNLITKKIIETRFQHFVSKGHNPFNTTQDRDEINNAQPQVYKMLQSLNFKDIKKEVKISPRSKVDFLCVTNDDKIICIEVKSDIKPYLPHHLNNQITKYNLDGQNKFKDSFITTFLVSPKGTYGININKLKKELKQHT